MKRKQIKEGMYMHEVIYNSGEPLIEIEKKVKNRLSDDEAKILIDLLKGNISDFNKDSINQYKKIVSKIDFNTYLSILEGFPDINFDKKVKKYFINLDINDVIKNLKRPIRRRRKETEFITKTALRKLMKEEGNANLVASEAVAYLQQILEEEAVDITKKALALSKHANRKKISKNDIKIII